MDSIIELFQLAMRSHNSHSICACKLTKVVDDFTSGKSNYDFNVVDFILNSCIDRVLILTKSKDSIDNIMTFIGIWLSGSSDEILNKCCSHLLKRSAVADKNVRAKVCQIIFSTLASLKDKELDEDLLRKIRLNLLPRLRDKVANVRYWSIRALKRLQNPYDNSDEIILEFIRLLSSDPSVDVRKVVIEVITISETTLPHIIERIKDVKSSVRTASILRLISDDVESRCVSRNQKLTLVRYGLEDRDSDVKDATKNLFIKWIKTANCNFSKFFTQIGVDSVEAETVAKAILEECDDKCGSTTALRSAAREQTIDWAACPFQSLALGELFWTLMRCEYYQQSKSSSDASDLIELLLPDTLQFCRLLREALVTIPDETGQSQLKTLLLLRLTPFADQNDEAGRAGLIDTCKELLDVISLSERLMESVLSVWLRIDDEMVVVNHLLTAASLLSERNGHNNQGPAEVADEEEDAQLECRVRAMEIAVWTLQHALGAATDVREAVFRLKPMIDTALQQPVPELRAMAIHCLGLMSLIEGDWRGSGAIAVPGAEDVFAYSRRVALQTVALDDEELCTRSRALHMLADMALVRPDSARQDNSMVNLLLLLLDGNQQDMLFTAAETSIKLLFNGVLSDPRLFAKLLVIFFQPEHFTTSDEVGDGREDGPATALSTRLQQLLNIFFKAYFRAGAGRELVALSSTVELVAEMSAMIREGDAEASRLIQVLTAIPESMCCDNM